MKKLFLVIVSMGVATSCGPIDDYRMKQEAKDALAYVLKDSVTAEFRDLTRSGSGLCGYVNAKNSMAGYTGFTQFVTEEGEAYVLGEKMVPTDLSRANELANRCKFIDPQLNSKWQSDHTNQVLDDYTKAAAEVARIRAQGQ